MEGYAEVKMVLALAIWFGTLRYFLVNYEAGGETNPCLHPKKETGRKCLSLMSSKDVIVL